MEILLADGRSVLCTPDNEHRDLFFGFPNSYGTLGYALKLKAREGTGEAIREAHPSAPPRPRKLFRRAGAAVRARGCRFRRRRSVRPRRDVSTLGRFIDEAPYTSDYTYKQIYYQSIRERAEDYLTTEDLHLALGHRLVLVLQESVRAEPAHPPGLGHKRLNSITYTKIMRWNSRWKLTRYLDRLLGTHAESVIQDVEMPIRRAAEFLDFFHRDIGILPVWLCPIHAGGRRATSRSIPSTPPPRT